MTSKAIEGKIIDVELKHSEVILIAELNNGQGCTITLQEKGFPFLLKDIKGKHLTIAVTDK